MELVLFYNKQIGILTPHDKCFVSLVKLIALFCASLSKPIISDGNTVISKAGGAQVDHNSKKKKKSVWGWVGMSCPTA
jgi:hypothetical protein